jgi:hypothetical protein
MWIIAAQTGAAVLQIALGVLIGLWGGQYLGGLLGGKDIGLLVGGGLGLLAAALGLWRLVKRARREEQ